MNKIEEAAHLVEPNMESAGAELMGLAHDMEGIPDLADRAERIREIGAWVSVSRMSDAERGLINMLGAMFGAMQRRNFVFSEDAPISKQFETFLDSIPDPLPGEIGYVDQNTLPPQERRDVFEAEVEMSDVRTWTAYDGITRGIAKLCAVRPQGGVVGHCSVFAEGGTVALLKDGGIATLRLRSIGGSLKIEDAA